MLTNDEKYEQRLIVNAQRRLKTKLRNTFIHRGWHEIDCPAHSNQMRPESECNCIYEYVLSSLLK